MSSLRVLVIEADPCESERLCSALAGANHTVLPTADLEEASEALSIQKFDAVLLGHRFPPNGLSGFCAALRQLEQNQRAAERIPVVSLSAQSLSPPLESFIHARLSEPFEPAEFAGTLRNLAKSAGSDGTDIEPDGCALPVFQPEEFMQQIGQDADLACEIIDLFLTESGVQMPAMTEAVSRGDYAELRSLAHTIKGSFASLYALRARHRAQQLETAATNEDGQHCRSCLALLEGDLIVLKTHLGAFRPNSSLA